MRGKDANGLNMLSNLGITPAYAGKRPSRLRRDHERRDHPRVCGEKKLAEFEDETGEGSPPRMRGKDFWHYADNYSKGITPAYAGKRQFWHPVPPVPEDHPRVCGEKCRVDFGILRGLGSPPRMRGKAVPLSRRCVHLRDHPRVCGEKVTGMQSTRARPGSPPRMRGKD